MTVGELIEYLEQYDRDAQVLLMEQPGWPFEYSINGVVSREEIINQEPDEDRAELGDGEEINDVFILEGTQLRYGTKKAWDGW
jgi:Glu-tRNA(Gln) amidotransferase subunit E-like FAD-binding protein